jgi:GT2 family glycosyltransferase/SAM-dependent methyltransferase/glycosyltransferase involved in cell wall biosynthesis
MNARHKHAMAVRLFNAGQKQDALTLLREVLAEEESSEVWSDWAAVQFSLNLAGEAEQGFRIALDLDAENVQAACNLGLLLSRGNAPSEAKPFLTKSLHSANRIERASAEALLAKRLPYRELPDGAAIEQYLRTFLSASANDQSYFETHVQRYVATLQRLPQGTASLRLLELGAAFHHLTPALQRLSRYGEVRCTDIWPGGPQETRTITSQTADETFSFVVDNFDLQHQPWPYRDGEFDAVLCCEILEHLHTDPMGLLAEMNRVLKPGGVLLLTTPNLASAHAVEEAMRGGSPYGYGKFEFGGKPTDRHNREYTAAEVVRLAMAAGFAISELRTFDFYWPAKRDVLRSLAVGGHPIAGRGDSTFLSARKNSAVKDRYPEELYSRVGLQAARRKQQSNGAQQTDVGRQEERESAGVDDLPRNILLVHEVLPHYDCSGADLRLYELVRELRAQNHSVTFLARDNRDELRYRAPLEALGAKVYAGDAERLRHLGYDNPPDWNLRDVLRRGQFDVAILSHWFWSGISVPEHYMDEIRLWSPATRVLVLSEDRHGERERRSAKLSGLFSDLERGNDFEQREAEVYRRADLVLYVTETDQARFLELVPGLLTEHLPTIADVASAGPSFAERQGVLFMGNFENLANRDALAWMLERVWPLVRQLEPTLTLYVAGNAAPEGLQDRYPGVACVGKIDKLGPQFDLRRVFAAPIRYGTGIITKNMHAIAHGLPVVTTTIGAEGLVLQNNAHALIADQPQEFAAALVRLYRDEGLWKQIASDGRRYIREKFCRANLHSQIRNILARASAIAPRAAETETAWSYRTVETSCPWVLAQQPAGHRPMLRLLAYWQEGKRHLEAHRAAPALEQFRHIFSVIRGPLPASVFHSALLRDVAMAYRELGDMPSATRCESEAGQAAWPWKTKLPQKATKGRANAARDSGGAELSVVLPTFNRSETLRVCLAALAFQSLPAERWEAVVVNDGSTDETETLCKEMLLPFQLTYVCQTNQGAGAARRAGVENAKGELLLLCNDDTIASSNLLVEHLSSHRDHSHEKIAVLGEFRYPTTVRGRALTLFVNASAFFFPQSALKPGQFYDQAYFVTCNLSVRRDAVLAAGNFDASFRVAEDTELGTRMAAQGLRVIYQPAAVAWHEHGPFTSEDLVRRAKAYGAANWDLFQKHPRLLGDGAGPFGSLSAQDENRLQTQVDRCGVAVANGLTALQALDGLDFRSLFADQLNGKDNAEELMRQVGQIVPLVYWHFLFESFLERWHEARCLPALGAIPQLHAQAQPG